MELKGVLKGYQAGVAAVATICMQETTSRIMSKAMNI